MISCPKNLIYYYNISIIYFDNLLNAYNKRKLYTKPINPDTSTNENPIKDHLTK